MKLRISLLFVLLTAIGLSAFSQENNNKSKQTLQGVVTDQSAGTALEFATVTLRDSATGKVLQGSTTDQNGGFSLQAPQGNYILELAFVGYTTAKHSIAVSSSGVKGMPAKLMLAQQDKEIDAVTVTARRPLIERKIDMLVMNVETMIMAETSTGLELLKQAPGVSVDNDGNITLNGKGVAVWIDGRPTNISGQELVMLLEGTEGSNVDKIEIIANHSSKYDAAGSGGIINIKTKKSFAQGLSGSARVQLRQYLYGGKLYEPPCSAGSLSLSYRTEKVATNLSYNTTNGDGFYNLTETLHTFDSLRRVSESVEKNYMMSHSAKASVDYFINKKNTVGVVAKVFSFTSSRDKNEYAQLYNTPSSPDSSRGSGNDKSSNVNGSINLNYTRTFDQSGQQLDANANYMRYNNDNEQDLLTRQFFYNNQPSELLLSNSRQHIDIYSINVDYAHPFGEKMKLEAGGKTAQSTTDNYNAERQTRNDSTLRNDINDFEYRELISALYANYAWQIDSLWSLKAGLRYENTYARGNWRSAGSKTRHTFNDFFPTLYIGFAPSQNHSFGLSYTRRIRRPSYWNLNPYRRVVNYYSIIEGNPNLKPAYTNTVRLDYMLFKFITLAADYSETRNEIFQTMETLPGNITLLTSNNVGLMQVGSLSLYAQYDIAKWWNASLNLMGYYFRTQYEEQDNRNLSSNARLNNTFRVGKTIKIELQGRISSPVRMYYMRQTTPQGAINLNLQKTFWDNAATLSLNISDIFGTNDGNTMDLNQNETYSHIEQQWNGRHATLSFSYKFGKVAKSTVRRKIMEDAEEGSRAGGGQ
ncbi:MAG: TonB-dependent receptor family protein [Prevotellaceae bacterium]|jgi:outer membrane receptor protein involved in Fe transport|nr:TonB-dependent receptor family protein [Prevotellaceae bacterium]